MLKLGEQKIEGLALGEQEIKKAYLGDNLVFSAAKLSRLPEGYTEVQYINNPTSTNGMCIDTGIYFDWSEDVIYEMDFDVLTVDSTLGADFMFAHSAYDRDKNGKYIFYYGTEVYTRNNTVWFNCWDSKKANQASSYVSFGMNTGRHLAKLDCKNVTLTIDDVAHKVSMDPVAPYFSQSKVTLKIMGNPRTDRNYCLNGNLYSFKAYSRESILHDFVPCTNLTGVVGLYDIVEDKFIQPNGVFIAGPAV